MTSVCTVWFTALVQCRRFAILLFPLLVLVAPAAYGQAVVPLASPQAQERLVKAIELYEHYVANGGWPVLEGNLRLEPGDRNPRVQQIRKRLAITEATETLAAPEAGPPDFYDKSLEKTVRAFQRRHGLLPDALIGPQTMAAMNVPAPTRLAQLRDSLDRSRRLARQLPSGRYVLVNIPAFGLEAVNDATVELDSVVIIGRRDRPTPEMRASLTAVNFNPTWHVPASIVRKDLFPRLLSDPDYFVRQDYRIFSGAGEIAPHQVREQGLQPQDIRMIRLPGAHNPLGRIRLDMPNKDAIYLHDSPANALFMRPERSYSAGCIRVARIVELSAWLLGKDLGAGESDISRALRESRSQTMKLPQSVPVFLAYIMAWVDADGTIQIRDDVYGHGAGGEIEGLLAQ